MIEIINDRVIKNKREQCFNCTSFDIRHTHWAHNAERYFIDRAICWKCSTIVHENKISFYNVVIKMDRMANKK